MKNQETLTLMYKDHEVLTFVVDYVNRPKIQIIKELDHFDLAPYGVKKDNDSNNMRLLRFFNSRKISENRWDYDLIIKNIGVRDSFELVKLFLVVITVILFTDFLFFFPFDYYEYSL